MRAGWLIFWVFLACGLCFLPSGWLTGVEGFLFPGTKGHTQTVLFWSSAKEPLAHGILMSGLAFSLMRLLSARPGRPTRGVGAADADESIAKDSPSGVPGISGPKGGLLSFSWNNRGVKSLPGVILIAALIEGIQSLLPASFSRGFAWGDIGASVVGGLLGIFLAVRRVSLTPG